MRWTECSCDQDKTLCNVFVAFHHHNRRSLVETRRALNYQWFIKPICRKFSRNSWTTTTGECFRTTRTSICFIDPGGESNKFPAFSLYPTIDTRNPCEPRTPLPPRPASSGDCFHWDRVRIRKVNVLCSSPTTRIDCNLLHGFPCSFATHSLTSLDLAN